MRTASRVNPCTLSKRAVYIIRVDDLSLSPTNITRFAFASHRSTVHPLHPSPPLPSPPAVVAQLSLPLAGKHWKRIGRILSARRQRPLSLPPTPPRRPIGPIPVRARSRTDGTTVAKRRFLSQRGKNTRCRGESRLRSGKGERRKNDKRETMLL